MLTKNTIGLVVILFLLLTACRTPDPLQESSPVTSPVVTLSQETSTSAPETDTQVSPVGILLAPARADLDLKNELIPLLENWSQEEGLRFQVRETLSEEDFTGDDIRWVAVLPPSEGLVELAQFAPGTRFLAIGFPDLEASGNVSVILPPAAYYDQQGFMAGYIAAMITPDWRVGVISIADSASGTAARDGFVNGVRYFCGLCQIEYPPYFSYPLFVELPAGSSPDQWQSAASLLVKKSVQTIYIVPGAGDSELYRFLAGEDVLLIGGEQPVPEENQPQWVLSLDFDMIEVLKEAWPEFVNGGEGKIYPLELFLNGVNPDLITPGQEINAQKILEEVENGFIVLE